MDKTNTPPSAFPSTVPMARIDGVAVRRLRESKGLTQLYMATVIGVTTDTISRWENRHYHSIKLDNAEKLAQALEVELQAILEQQAAEAPPAVAPLAVDCETPPPHTLPPAAPLASAAQGRRPLPPWLVRGAGLLALAGFALWLRPPSPPRMDVTAERILPAHIPLGQSFPVLIRVTRGRQEPVSLILRETIPPGCRVVGSEPPLTSEVAESGILKWVTRADQQVTTFAYMAQAPVKGDYGGQLQFSGGVTSKQDDQTPAVITGAGAMEIAPYHWADVDRNNTIDDEEILAVYDRYSAMPRLDFGRDRIDGIWAASGYAWDRKAGKYVLQK